MALVNCIIHIFSWYSTQQASCSRASIWTDAGRTTNFTAVQETSSNEQWNKCHQSKQKCRVIHV